MEKLRRWTVFINGITLLGESTVGTKKMPKHQPIYISKTKINLGDAISFAGQRVSKHRITPNEVNLKAIMAT